MNRFLHAIILIAVFGFSSQTLLLSNSMCQQAHFYTQNASTVPFYVSADAAAVPDSLSGQKIFKAASEYVFSGRKLQLRITNMDKKGNAYYSTGYFVAVADRGYMKIDGVSEFQYSPSLVTSFNYETNEYIIQQRKSTASSVSDNPFSILARTDKGVSVSAPEGGDVGGVSCTKITVKPLGKAYYTQAFIYVSGSVNENLRKLSSQPSSSAGLEVLRFTIVLKRDQAFVVDVLAAGASEPDKVADYKLLVSDHPGAEVVDLRD